MRALFLVLSLTFFSCSSQSENQISQGPVPAHLQTLFPKGIITIDQSPAELNTLNDKVIAFYFITQGNPHAPKTTELMSILAANYSYRFKVIVVNPHDQDQTFIASFKNYKELFYMVEPGQAKKLAKKYRITSAPSVVVIDTEGKLITRNGVDTIIDNTPRLPGGWN